MSLWSACSTLPSDELPQCRDRNSSTTVDRRDRGNVQLQALNLVVQRDGIWRRRRGRWRIRRAGAIRVSFDQNLLLGQIDQRVLLRVSVAAGGVDLDRLLAI